MTFDYDQFMADREVALGGIADPYIAQAAASAFTTKEPDMIDLDRIDIRHLAHEWRVWLPHSCSPDEPVGDEHDQAEWGDFYFTTFNEAAAFVGRTLTERNQP